MFCPVCKAEFRDGFRQCSDCGIDLVEVAPRLEERFHAIRAEAPAEFDELLARSKNPRFYLGLLTVLANHRIRCYGKALNLIESGPVFSGAVPEFEVWVSKEQSRLAAWIRDSLQEDYEAEDQLDLEEEQVRLGPATEAIDSAKLCALCSAEYTGEAALCENCGSALFWGNQLVPQGDLGRVLFRQVQPQILGALRTALIEQRIPFNNALLYKEGLLRANSSASSTEVVIRNMDFDRATGVLAHILEAYEFEPIPMTRAFADPTAPHWPRRADQNLWQPEELTGRVWTGRNFFQLDGVAQALREHEIPYRSETSNSREASLFVHPEDDLRAREILEDIVEGPPAE